MSDIAADDAKSRVIRDGVTWLIGERELYRTQAAHYKAQLRAEHADLVAMCRAFRESDYYCPTTHEGEITDRVLAEEDGPDE